MTIIFRAKTKEAYVFKILSEILASNIKTGCFVIDSEGIFLRMMDHHRRVLIDLKLFAENLTYKFVGEKMHLGINLNHFYRLLKSVKKKDSLEIFIDDDDITDLCIKVFPKETGRPVTSSVKIQSIQNLAISLPTDYGKPIIVLSNEYQKTLKDMTNIATSIKTVSRKNTIDISCDASGILKKRITFGEEDDSEDEDEEDGIVQEFSSEQLRRVNKIASLNTNMKIYTGKQLQLKSNIGDIGEISIYIKSSEEIDRDSMETKDVETEEESSDSE